MGYSGNGKKGKREGRREKVERERESGLDWIGLD